MRGREVFAKHYSAAFVGRGIGTNALGAINLVSPFIMVIGAVNMLISVGGVAIYAVRRLHGTAKLLP